MGRKKIKTKQLIMDAIIKAYKKWKVEHPEEDYQYDCINEFFDNFGRGDLLDLIEFAEQQYDKMQLDGKN